MGYYTSATFTYCNYWITVQGCPILSKCPQVPYLEKLLKILLLWSDQFWCLVDQFESRSAALRRKKRKTRSCIRSKLEIGNSIKIGLERDNDGTKSDKSSRWFPDLVLMEAAWLRGSVRASHPATLGSKHGSDIIFLPLSLDCLVHGQY